jgi:flagellar hook-associated protein 1 FlgK
MSLIGSLNIGKSALATHQASIQTIGNNIANAGNENYTRQVAKLEAVQGQKYQQGILLGAGVNLQAVQRQIDEALEGRIRGSISDSESANQMQQWLGRVEAVFNELSDDDLSTQFSTFFNSWSNLANKPQDIGLRQVVIQNGESVAKTFKSLRGSLESLKSDTAARLQGLAKDADSIASQIAQLNGKITQAEAGAGGANSLRDQRDALLKDLSKLVDIKTLTRDSGATDVYINSEPLIIGASSKGLYLKQEVVDGETAYSVCFKSNNGPVTLKSGQLGAVNGAKGQIQLVEDNIDSLANAVIFELNKVHASGQGLQGFSTIQAGNSVEDSAVALNDEDAGLNFAPTNGSFVVHVKNKITGLTTSTLVQVDLDGANANDTTLNSLSGDIDAIDNISSSVSGGRLSIRSDSSDVEISFSQDTSGVLAALGVNNFFAGKNASDIAVATTVKSNPSLLAAAMNGQPADNQTARAIAALESAAVTTLQGQTLKDNYQTIVNNVATSAQSAKTNAEAASVVQETLLAQHEALSGVSLDEEALNLMREQRAYQGAARLISVVNELMDELMLMAR